MTTTQATLLERLRDGDDAVAWDEFFARYWPTIYRYARHRGCDEPTAEEIVQEVMLKVFQQRDVYRYDPMKGRFRDWLGAVVRNQVAEHYRRPANRVHGKGGDSNGQLEDVAADSEESDELWERIFEEQLLAALLSVVRRETSARSYLAFELIAIEGMSGHEAARLTGLSRNAVYKAHKRVIERLIELGAPYRSEGKLSRQIREAMAERPPASRERSLTERIQKTMCSR